MAAVPALAVAMLARGVAEREVHGLHSIFAGVGVEATCDAARLVHGIVVEVDIYFRSITARLPASELVQLLIPNGHRHLCQASVLEVVRPSLVLRDIRADRLST